MSDKSSIEWTDATWTVVQGCDPVSQGCVHCYAVGVLWRLMHNPDPKISGPLQGLVEKYVNASGEEILRFTGKLALREDRLDWPLKWSKPRMIFVPSHGDIFHKDVPREFIRDIFATMYFADQHTFQVLTKRAERMRLLLSKADFVDDVLYAARVAAQRRGIAFKDRPWPLPNVWCGISAERQEEWDERKEHLRNTPAAVRFASFEPLLGKITELNLADYIQWGIIGGESGGKARDTWTPNVRWLLRQHQKQNVRAFVKQMGTNVQDRDDAGFEGCGPREWHVNDFGRIEHSPNGVLDEGYQGAPVRVRLKDRKGGDWNEWPEDLRVREFPVTQSRAVAA